MQLPFGALEHARIIRGKTIIPKQHTQKCADENSEERDPLAPSDHGQNLPVTSYAQAEEAARRTARNVYNMRTN
ncbi:MAG: hypothetical protein ACWGSD_20350, partial [Thermodesulfobacteriota bacterium]